MHAPSLRSWWESLIRDYQMVKEDWPYAKPFTSTWSRMMRAWSWAIIVCAVALPLCMVMVWIAILVVRPDAATDERVGDPLLPFVAVFWGFAVFRTFLWRYRRLRESE